jgi:hypothetical protein
VQTKAVAHPTDSHLLMRGIERRNALAKQHGVVLRQSFLRPSEGGVLLCHSASAAAVLIRNRIVHGRRAIDDLIEQTRLFISIEVYHELEKNMTKFSLG